MSLPISHSIRALLLGQTVEFESSLPLEDCLRLLQSKTEERGLFLVKYQKVIIMYISRDIYLFKLSKLGQGRGKRYTSVRGELKRSTDGTIVTVSTKWGSDWDMIILAFIMAAPIVVYFLTHHPYIAAVAILLPPLSVLGLIGEQDTKVRLMNVVYQTLQSL